jgi:hypothetical protein
MDVSKARSNPSFRLLVCGTNEQTVDSVCIVLEEEGYNLDIAFSLTEAAECISNRNADYDLLIIGESVSAECREALWVTGERHGLPTYVLRKKLDPQQLVSDVFILVAQNINRAVA